MPMRAARLCNCGHRVASGVRCPCERREDAARKARFDKRRPCAAARGYDRDWQEASKRFLREHRFCRRCGKAAALVDHIRPHRGDQALFWERTNWQALCGPCHSSGKQRDERRGSDGMFDITAFAAAGAKLYIGMATTDFAALDRHDWTPVARLETIGSARFTGGFEVTARLDDLDLSQGILRACAVSKAPRAFRFVFADGSERVFVARILSARDRPSTGRLRAVLTVLGDVVRTSTPMLAVAS
jgi:5-methylcytosine-specific restriction protein A